jgi:hypothetical protein
MTRMNSRLATRGVPRPALSRVARAGERHTVDVKQESACHTTAYARATAGSRPS